MIRTENGVTNLKGDGDELIRDLKVIIRTLAKYAKDHIADKDELRTTYALLNMTIAETFVEIETCGEDDGITMMEVKGEQEE